MDNDTLPVSAGGYDQSAPVQSYSSSFVQTTHPLSTVAEPVESNEDEKPFEIQSPVDEFQNPPTLEEPQDGPLEDLDNAIEAIQAPPTPQEDVSKSGFNFKVPLTTARRYLKQRF